MPEINVFMTDDEFRCAVLSWAQRGFRFVELLDTFSSEPVILSETKDVKLAFEAGVRAFLLVRSDFTRHATEMSKFTRNGVEQFHPRTNEGGPSIEVKLWEKRPVDRKSYIPQAMIALTPHTLCRGTGVVEPAGEAALRAYREIVNPIKKVSRCVRATRIHAFVSPGAIDLLARGWKLSPPYEDMPIEA